METLSKNVVFSYNYLFMKFKKALPWIIVLLLLALLGFGAYYFIFNKDVSVSSNEMEGLEAIRPRNMQIKEVRSDSFIVEWQTNTEVVGYVKYGDTSTALPLMAQDVEGTEPRKKHRVIVDGLTPGRKYYFWVMSNDIAFGKENRALEVLTLSEE
jgi:hypothetical protein